MALADRATDVYCITFPNGKKYYGITACGIENRIQQHLTASKSKDTKLYNAMRKYNTGDLVVEYVTTCNDKKEAAIVEQAYIKTYDTIRNGYNTTEGGEGAKGYSFTDEDRLRISEVQKERFKRQEERIKTSEALVRWRLENPDEYRKIEEKRIATTSSDEHKEKMSVVMKEYYSKNPEKVEASKISHQKYYEEHPETSVAISRSLGGKAIEVYRDGCLVETFQTLMDCARTLNLSSGNIGMVLSGKRNHTHGYTFKRAE